MSKHRGGKDDFAEHPAKARDEVKKRGKKAAVTSPITTMFLLTQAKIVAESRAAFSSLVGKGVPLNNGSLRVMFLSDAISFS